MPMLEVACDGRAYFFVRLRFLPDERVGVRLRGVLADSVLADRMLAHGTGASVLTWRSTRLGVNRNTKARRRCESPSAGAGAGAGAATGAGGACGGLARGAPTAEVQAHNARHLFWIFTILRV